jgi:hypothetical protein
MNEIKKLSVRRLVILLVLIPIIIISSGWIISGMHLTLSRQHSTVALAEEIMLEDSGEITETTLETRTFRASGKPISDLLAEARSIQDQFKVGGWFLGGFLGLIFSLKLVKLSVRRKEVEYTANTGTCYSCARCFDYCPFEQVRIAPLNKTSILNEF